MKKFVLLTVCTFTFLTSYGQVPSGQKLQSNITGTDITGNPVDVFKLLDEGKSVVIDVFATWCGPCWSFHNTHTLENFYEAFGPAGTNDISVLGIEADNTTPLNHLFQEVAGTQSVPPSLGDWTAGVTYPIMNNHLHNTTLQIAYFPTLYIIRPDRTMIEMGDYRGNTELWLKAMKAQGEKDVVLFSALTDRTFCTQTPIAGAVSILNMGSTEITDISLEIAKNQNTTLASAGPVGVFQTISVNIPGSFATQTTNLLISVDDLDSQEDVADESSTVDVSFIKPIVSPGKVTLKVTTDFYPGEFSWILKNDKNQIIDSKSYIPGNEDQFGGGGADAYHTFTYDYTVAGDIKCLSLTLNDAYGDGISIYDPAIVTPGIEILAENGTVVKPLMVSDVIWTTSTDIFTSVGIVSGVEDDILVKDMIIATPNPTNAYLSYEINDQAIDGRAYITNTLGSVVMNLTSTKGTVDLSDLPKSIYLLNYVSNKDNKVYTQKIVKY